MDLQTLELRRMAKTRGRPKGERDDVTVKLDRAIANKLKAVSKHRGVPVAELLTEMAEVPTNRAYLLMLRELEGKA